MIAHLDNIINSLQNGDVWDRMQEQMPIKLQR